MTNRSYPIALATLLTFFASYLPPVARAQIDQPPERLQRYLEHLEANNKFMGTAAVSINGKKIFEAQVGQLAIGDQKVSRPDSETQYRIGSITKTFTAVMILQLVEESELSLDTKLSEFFPELQNAELITIEHMLRHRSGLGSVTDDPTYVRWNTQAQTKSAMLERIAQQPKQFEPDERAGYSNTNYILLGYIIEKITGNSYAAELKSRIADRIDLKRTAYFTPADADKNVALSFSWLNNQWSPRRETDPSIPHGAGAIMSTASDLIVFIESLFDGKLITSSSLAQMTTLVDRMGMGIIQLPFGSKRAFAHNGGIDGFQSSLGYFPEDKIAIALIGNGFNYPMNDVMLGLLRISFEEDFELPSFDEVEVDAAALKRFEGVYSSAGIPLKITVEAKGGRLTAQATGQSAFPLVPTSQVEFKFDAAGIVIAFAESKEGSGFDLLRLKQAGQDIQFKKDLLQKE